MSLLIGKKLVRGVKKISQSLGFSGALQQLSFWYANQVVTAVQMNEFGQDIYDKIAAITDRYAPCVVTLKGSISQNGTIISMPTGFFRFIDTSYSFMSYSSCICGVAQGVQLSPITGNGFIVARYSVSPVTQNQTNYTFPTQYIFTANVNPVTDCMVCVITNGQISGYGQFFGTPSITDNGAQVTVSKPLFAPTASAGTNNTQVANMAALVQALANALSNYTTTQALQLLLNAKASLSGANFTGEVNLSAGSFYNGGAGDAAGHQFTAANPDTKNDLSLGTESGLGFSQGNSYPATGRPSFNSSQGATEADIEAILPVSTSGSFTITQGVVYWVLTKYPTIKRQTIEIFTPPMTNNSTLSFSSVTTFANMSSCLFTDNGAGHNTPSVELLNGNLNCSAVTFFLAVGSVTGSLVCSGSY